jgi:flagellar biosynthesis/type III secretory pathway M-ring protein FliF/YscJ
MSKSTIVIIIYIIGLVFGALVLDIWSAQTSPKALIGNWLDSSTIDRIIFNRKKR